MSIPTPLVNTPEATEFIASMSLPTPRKAQIGDPQKLHGDAYNAVTEFDRVMAEAVVDIQRLPNDETRTEVSRQAYGKEIADHVNSVGERSQRRLEQVAAKLSDEGTALIEAAFDLNPTRAVLHSDIRKWISENANTVEGRAKIDEAVRTDKEFAAVVYQSPHQLLGLSRESKDTLWGKAAKLHAPKGVGMLIQSVELTETAARYPQIMRSVSASFYNSALAARAKNRVGA